MKKHVTRSLFAGSALALVAAPTLATGAASATTDSSTSYDHSMMMSNDDAMKMMEWGQGMDQALMMAAHNTGDMQLYSQFAWDFNNATMHFAQRMQTATWKWHDSQMTDHDRDMFEDSFNNAKAMYMNEMEMARNHVVDTLSGKDDVHKDMFVNNYNAWRDMFGNKLEMLKTDPSWWM